MTTNRFFVLLLSTLFFLVVRTLSESLRTTTEVGTTEEDEVHVPTFGEYCKDLRNVTAQPKKILYYQCLPLILKMAKLEDMYQTEESYFDVLQQPPNEDEPTAKINVVFEQLNLLSYSVVDTSDSHPDVQIEFKLSWQDDRYKWNEEEWRFKIYPTDLKATSQIWVPEFSLKGANAIGGDIPEAVQYPSIRVSYTGNISATAVAQITFTKCQVDVAAYPNDLMSCCITLDLSPKEKIVADLSKLTTIWDAKAINVWKIDTIELKHNQKKSSDPSQAVEPASSLQLCMSSKRNTAALGAELSLPMAVSAIVLMCAQLAGKWKMQVYVKLFAILIQIYAFQGLVPNDILSNATRLPKVYLFYNFTVAVTLFSLFQTMLFWALSRRWFIMPPPHKLTLSMKVISRVLLGDKLERIEQRNNERLEVPKNTDYRKEWEVIFGTCHAILSLLIIVGYLIGIVIIYASKD